MGDRKAIFISHATPEDNDFTLWLGAKLSAMGYEVWADVLRLRGGDDWARKLENALRNRAKKVILVANDVSVGKQGVRNEIQIATEVAKKLGDTEFIIPLRISNYDAPFLIAQTQYIDFKRSWSDGLTELLQVLEEYSVPRPEMVGSRAGLESWRNAYLHKSRLIENNSETLISNWLPIDALPQYIRVYDFKAGIAIAAKDQALRNSSIPLVPHKRGFIGFATLEEYQELFGENLPLLLVEEIELSEFLEHGMDSQDIESKDAYRKLVDLMRQALENYLTDQELSSTSMANGQLAWWWPNADDNEGKIRFAWENGPCGKRQIVGFLPKSNIYWHFGLSFSAHLSPIPHVKLISRVIFTEDGMKPFGKTDYMFRLRRSKTKSWRNPRWRDMMLAFLAHLSKGGDCLTIHFGRDSLMTVSLPPIMFEAPVTVNEDDISEEDIIESEEFSLEDDPDDEAIDFVEYEGQP